MKTKLLFTILFFCTLFSNAQNLIAYYPFNGNANDESGKAINPTYIGSGVTLTTDRFGNANKAYNFDGAAGSYIKMPADLLPTTNRTISLWFNVPDVSNRPGLLGYGGSGSCGTTMLMGLNLLGAAQFYVQGHCGNNAAGYGYPSPPLNKWYHWVLTISGSSQKIYVNGQLKSTDNTFSGSTAVSGKDFSLGVITSISGTAPFTDANVGYLNGKLDDVRIYDAAMTDEQVLSLYDTESTGLVAYYPFNGNANDESGNGINSTYTGSGVTLTADRFGNANKAYYLNGEAGSYIRIPADKFPATDRTISFWFNADDPAVYRVPFSYGGNGCDASCFLMILNQSGSGTYMKTGHCNFERVIVPYSTPPVNNWKQWVITINGSVQKIYIDGVLQSPSTNENFLTPTYVAGRYVLLGAMVNTDGNTVYQDGVWNFKGKLDEFRIYNNAMNDTQVLSLFKNESGAPIAYYPFNGNANDESGNGYNGVVSEATSTTDRFEQTGKAYNFTFNGTSSDKIQIAGTSALNFTAGAFSISSWFWFSGTAGAGNNYPIFSKHNCGEQSGYILMLYNDKITFWMAGAAGYSYLSTPESYTDGQWHQVTAVYDGANRYIYIDGQQKISDAFSYTVPNGANWALGGYNGCNGGFNGKVDEIRVYNRRLTSTEILQQYKNESTGLVAYYPFNGNANDESGNENHGIVNGASLTSDRFGNASKAYSFTNPNHISVSNSNMFGDEFSVSYWFKISSYFGQRAVMSNVASPNGGFQQEFDGTTFTYILGYNFPLSSDPLTSNYTMQEPVNQWNHLVLTYKKTGTTSSESKLFINDDLKKTSTYSLSILFTPNATFYIGQNHSGLNFQGDLDDVRIYNRILSPAEISNLYTINDLKIKNVENGAANNFYVSNNTLYFKNAQDLNSIKTVKVYNLLGQKVFDTSKIKAELFLNYLTKGVYILKIENNDGKISSLKFLME